MVHVLMLILQSRLKPVLRWLILGAVLFFLLKTLQTHWREVASLRIDAAGLACLAIALGITLLAHIFAGYVWAWIFKDLAHPMAGAWGAQVYLKTNIAKYLPGNVWHFYGRVSAATKVGIPVEAATLSVVLEPLLMAAAACILAIVGIQQLVTHSNSIFGLQLLVPILILCGIHPKFFNPVLKRVSKLKKNTSQTLRIHRYPLVPLLGEIGFLGLRSLGFILTLSAITPIDPTSFSLLIGAFSWAWLLGLITPGLPGGVGVFEAVILALLGQHFPAGEILGVVALYRLVNTIAEGLGAGLVVLDEKRSA
jgi:uncharacterized membrane protein YbhN (UPF0104 family)